MSPQAAACNSRQTLPPGDAYSFRCREPSGARPPLFGRPRASHPGDDAWILHGSSDQDER